MTDKVICEIFKSLKHEEMYLYVDKREGFARVPEALFERLGDTAKVTTLVLTRDRKLARVRADDVLASIAGKGFYLQLPPRREQMADAQMRELAARNEKLRR